MLSELNTKYFRLFADLYTNRSFFSGKQYDRISESLFAEYKRELDELLSRKALEAAEDTYRLKYRLRHYLPKGVWIFKNKIAKEYTRIFEKEFARQLKDVRDGASSVGSAPALPQGPAELLQLPDGEGGTDGSNC